MSQRILIVEDERIVALDLAAKVSGMGYEVVGSAASGQRALEMAREGRPDCVLMDIRLEGDMDGIEATARIKREADVPVIYMTAFSDPDTRSRAEATAPSDILIKPVPPTLLQQAIHKALTRDAA